MHTIKQFHLLEYTNRNTCTDTQNGPITRTFITDAITGGMTNNQTPIRNLMAKLWHIPVMAYCMSENASLSTCTNMERHLTHTSK